MSLLIDLQGITKTYRTGEVDVPVLRGIDLQIDRGEQVVIMGRSGSGKSTLMNILGCLDQPTGGRYALDGHQVAGLPDDDISRIRGQLIGFVFQAFHLLKGRTVVENVELPLEYQDVAPEAGRVRAISLLERVGREALEAKEPVVAADAWRLALHLAELEGDDRAQNDLRRSLATLADI